MANIRLLNGALFDPYNPDPSLVGHGDIAHSLSNLCRFNGHCQPFYSVAQHSVEVERDVRRNNPDASPEIRMWALMHDAPESLTGFGDVCGPVKPAFLTNLEAQIMRRVICRHYALGVDMPPEVRDADLRMLALEARDLLGVSEDELRRDWNLTLPGPDVELPKILLPHEAAGEFLRAFEDISSAMEAAHV